MGREVLALVLRGLRPWNEMLEGEIWCFRTVMVEGVNKEDEAAIFFPLFFLLFCVLVDALMDDGVFEFLDYDKFLQEIEQA